MEVYGFGCSPIFENSIALVLSDGRTLVWDVKRVEKEGEDDDEENDDHDVEEEEEEKPLTGKVT